MRTLPPYATGRRLTEADLESRGRETALAPTRRECESAGATVTETADGKWTADFSGVKDGREVVGEMTRPWRVKQADRRMNDPTVPRTIEARTPDGQRVRVIETRADFEGAAGRILPVTRWHGLPGSHFQRGREGRMMWRWDGDYWEPLGRESVNLLSRRLPRRGLQVDPDGGVWRGFSHGWERVS